MRPTAILSTDLTRDEWTAVDLAVQVANAASAVVHLPAKQRQAVILAAVRSMDHLTSAERARLVRYFTVS